jgi:Trk K+ transport system NAD-binding subunit
LVFNDKDLCQKLEKTVSHPSYKSRVNVRLGDILNNFELENLYIQKAKAIFFLSSSKHLDPISVDEKIILNVLAVKNFNPNLDIYAQAISLETKEYLIQIGVNVVLSISDLKLKFISRNIIW